jgi:prepilin-type N-terminal cleavage/methylation domain-containing protein
MQDERAFTLIEMLVAMVLLAIAVALVSHGVLSALNASTQSRTGAISDAAMARISQQFQSDVAMAETTDRIAGRIRDPFDLERAVRRGEGVTTTDPTAPANAVVDIYDIRAATDDRIVLLADVLPDTSQDPSVDAPAECVIWDVNTSGSPARVHYTRTIESSCGGPVVETREMLSVPANIPGIDAHPFTYRLECHPSACPGNAAPDGPPSGRPCGTWNESTVTGKDRAWIVGVRMHVMAGAAEGHAASTTGGLVEATIRSRTTTEYASALGC